jgi:hypothetical protein
MTLFSYSSIRKCLAGNSALGSQLTLSNTKCVPCDLSPSADASGER